MQDLANLIEGEAIPIDEIETPVDDSSPIDEQAPAVDESAHIDEPEDPSLDGSPQITVA